MFDIHPHVISKDTEKYPIAPLGGKRSAWSLERPADVDELLVAMDSADIKRAAVVQSATTYGNDNGYLADVVDQHRDRLTGVCTVDLVAPDAVERLKYWLEDRGLAGIRLFTSGSTMTHQSDWMNAQETNPAWAYLNRTRYPVCVQMRPPGIPMLRDVLTRFPDLRIIVDNAARVEMTDAGMRPLFELAEVGEVYVKVTTNTLRRAGDDAPGFMSALIEAFGSDHVAWGSDFPAMAGSMTEFVALARESVAGLPETDQIDFFDKTATALYPEVPCES